MKPSPRDTYTHTHKRAGLLATRNLLCRRLTCCNRRLPITICSGKSCTAGRPAGRVKPVTLCHAIKKWLLECSRRSKNSVLSVEEYTEHDFTCFRSIFCKKSENFWNFQKFLEFRPKIFWTHFFFFFLVLPRPSVASRPRRLTCLI